MEDGYLTHFFECLWLPHQAAADRNLLRMQPWIFGNCFPHVPPQGLPSLWRIPQKSEQFRD
jgi:hypothetical protein